MPDGDIKSEIPEGVSMRLNDGPYDYYEIRAMRLRMLSQFSDAPEWMVEGNQFPFRDQAIEHAAAIRKAGAEAVVVIGRKYP